MAKSKVSIGEVEIKVSVFAFLLAEFKPGALEEINAFVSKNTYNDDLTGNAGQVIIDEQQKIVYTGSSIVAGYIRSAYKMKRLSKGYHVTVFKKEVSEDMMKDIIKTAGSSVKQRKQALPHNLQPVLDAMTNPQDK